MRCIRSRTRTPAIKNKREDARVEEERRRVVSAGTAAMAPHYEGRSLTHGKFGPRPGCLRRSRECGCDNKCGGSTQLSP